ncbi:unnamed protein product [Diatraea saccharalis]|uniref:Uncharacterized protein n=1 Tax=Diatraea saccharalis TaxID=40085 RepID=A0A9P0FZ68_9NEOP|nr:unnamed protein product [Diatraea saccharalis]
MEVLNENKVLETNEAVEEYIDIEVLSQEQKNYIMDLPESSDSESISSIVIPQRKLFTQKENLPQKKFGQLIETRETLAKLHKTTNSDKTLNVAPRNLFSQAPKTKSKPVFPAALLNISPNKTANKTKETTVTEVRGQVRTLFGNKGGTKRKNMFADFIVSDSDEDISEIQPKVFGFQRKDKPQQEPSTAYKRDTSPTSSITIENEMEDWKLLPSSTMVENQLEEMMTTGKTPLKRAKLSHLKRARLSKEGDEEIPRLNGENGGKNLEINEENDDKNLEVNEENNEEDLETNEENSEKNQKVIEENDKENSIINEEYEEEHKKENDDENQEQNEESDDESQEVNVESDRENQEVNEVSQLDIQEEHEESDIDALQYEESDVDVQDEQEQSDKEEIEEQNEVTQQESEREESDERNQETREESDRDFDEDDQEQVETQEMASNNSSAEIEDTNENEVQIDDGDNEQIVDENVEENGTPNVSHDTTGRHRKKEHSKENSPQVILYDQTRQMESFMQKGRNTSLRRTSLMKSMNVRASLAPPNESIALSDGTRNSSAEGSGWDSHRTTRKTLRQTFGKDFSPRKSLRTLVIEKSAKRQTAFADVTSISSKVPLGNSTELPEAPNLQDELATEANHDISKRTRQTTLELYLQKIKTQNLERKMKMEENVRNTLKAPSKDILNPFKVPSKSMFSAKKTNMKQVQNKSKPKTIKSTLINFADLPPEMIEDMKYKPPKRYQPSNASWITKRLYKFFETKLEPKYDYKARVRAEKLVETLYQFAKELRRVAVAPAAAVDALKHEMARLLIVDTHYEFYQFFHDYMPREVRVKVSEYIMYI